MKSKKLLITISCSCILVALIACLSIVLINKNPKTNNTAISDAVINLDLNPSVSLAVDDKGKVTAVYGNNDEGKMIIQINEALDFDEADIVILKIVYNFKFKEIAEYKNLTIGSVQSTYYQALEKLRKEFGK